MRHALLAAAFLGLAAPAASAAGEAALDVALDHARILKIDRPASTIVVGNPSIVDVTVNDSRTLILTGRSYGLTNVVVLDEAGGVILDGNVTVTSEEASTLRVYRQAERVTYSCAHTCEPTARVGDANDAFSQTISQFGAREGMVSRTR